MERTLKDERETRYKKEESGRKRSDALCLLRNEKKRGAIARDTLLRGTRIGRIPWGGVVAQRKCVSSRSRNFPGEGCSLRAHSRDSHHDSEGKEKYSESVTRASKSAERSYMQKKRGLEPAGRHEGKNQKKRYYQSFELTKKRIWTCSWKKKGKNKPRAKGGLRRSSAWMDQKKRKAPRVLENDSKEREGGGAHFRGRCQRLSPGAKNQRRVCKGRKTNPRGDKEKIKND